MQTFNGTQTPSTRPARCTLNRPSPFSAPDTLNLGTKRAHLRFGGAMADYGELKGRYARVQALEEENVADRVVESG
jgi:hypothetical protein